MPIIATPGFLKLTLALGFCLDHHDNLVTGLHQFRLCQHTSTARKALKACSYQHQFITGGGVVPSLSDVATLTAPDGFSLPTTLAMIQGAHTYLRVVMVTLFGPYHPTTLPIRNVNIEIMER